MFEQTLFYNQLKEGITGEKNLLMILINYGKKGMIWDGLTHRTN